MYLIILTLYPHRIPTWGVSDWFASQSSHIRTHIRTQSAHRNNTIIHIYTCKQQYAHTEKKYNNMHTERTQNAHTQNTQIQDTEYNIYAAHTYQHRTREQRTVHTRQRTTSTHLQCTQLSHI